MAARETGDPGKEASQSGAMDRTSSPAKPQWLEDADKTVGASDDNLDLRSTNSNGSDNRNSSATLPTPPEDDRISLPSETEDHVLFPNVVYLGAASMRSPRAEAEIMKYLATLSREEKTSVLVDLLVPRIPQGTVVLYEQGTEDEVAKYPVFRIIFCAKGGKTTDTTSNCFAFTFGHGSNEEAVFLCHAFRCQSAEQVTNIMMCFASAFRKPVTSRLSQGELAFVFDVSVEIKEEDSKGAAYAACPREGRDCFKVSQSVDILITCIRRTGTLWRFMSMQVDAGFCSLNNLSHLHPSFGVFVLGREYAGE
ncbi:hypothetical protein RvY_05843 [Ramazzottius varieornatus]|uniref:PID domain-containing protein n=1 Tax=Ramazzottius varieornatus TaxID=947166 RepID=A0A1D1UWH0_RAMVA|nr:hypothetical protein RvY_05843 [Ramazzottius varieornatus]